MSHDYNQNHYGPNASFDGYDSDLASAGILIDSLQQQLAAALAAIKSKDAALQSAISAHRYESGDLHDALAIQPDDMKDVILCHAEPVGWCGTSGVGEFIVSKSKIWNFLTTPLYRAWEPK